MDFITSIKTGFRKYVDFNGRASRSEYWWWQLFLFIFTSILYTLSWAIYFIVAFTGSILEISIPALTVFITICVYAIGFVLTIIEYTIPLVFLLPSLAVLVRRLHDAGYNGWWALLIKILYLFCFTGLIVEIVFACLQSVPEENEYGPVPVE